MASMMEEFNYPKIIIDKIEKFFGSLLGPAVRETGELITDRIRFYRFNNQVKILDKSRILLEKKNIKPDSVSIKLLVPLLENASLESNEKLQNMWANLLANACRFNFKESFHKVCVDILSNISPLEVKLLDSMNNDIKQKIENSKLEHDQYLDSLPFRPSSIYYQPNKIYSLLGLKQEEGEFLVENLVRLNILRWDPSEGTENDLRLYDFICLTSLGYQFIKECSEFE